MSKKNDLLPQKNLGLSPNPTVRDSQSPERFESENAAERSSVFLNKTTLLGTGVLVLALVSVAIPYSLGWLTPTQVAEADEIELENPVHEALPSDSNTVKPHVTKKVDDGFTDFDPNQLDMFAAAPLTASEPPLASPPAAGKSSPSAATGVPATASATGMGELEEFSTIADLEDGFDDSEQLLAQPEPQQNAATAVGDLSLDVPEEEEEDDGEKTAVTELEPVVPAQPTQAAPVVDRSALNRHNPADSNSTVNSPTPRRLSARIANHDPNPDTVHPIDKDDINTPKPHMIPPAAAQFAVAGGKYTTQSLPGAIEEPTLNPDHLAPADFDKTERSPSPQPAPIHETPPVARKEYQPRFAKIRQESRALPNADGQLWCPYDITPYTKAPGTPPGSFPEQTLIKWILRQTGEEFWHTEPFGLLNATSDTLYVYHTPQTQEEIAAIVDRFVNPQAEDDGYMFRIASLNGPNWLTQFHATLKPIRIDTQGVQGWLIAKEDYARMIPELARRSDYKELCSPQFAIKSGRQYVVSSSVPKNYTSAVQPKDDVWPGYSSEMAVIKEGYEMSLIPLTGIDGVSADILVKCDSMQVEKMHAVPINVPSRATSRQRVTVESPQVSHFHLDEQIRWPKDKVLLLSLGTIPVPAAAQYNDAGKLIPEISRKISGSPAARGHVLLFVECKKQ